ncbi:fused MFS/spermidine synthase, partial [Candidatus Auribacterota bacterium]
MQVIFYLLFFLSGITGLVYETIWVRIFTTVFGNTTYSVTAVLTAFLSGLGLGSYLFGRYIDGKKNNLKICSQLEFCIGITGIAVPLLIKFLEPFYAYIYQHLTTSLSILTAIKFILSFWIMLIPTFFMGATLPVLSSFLVNRADQINIRVGCLYAFNTLGAALGCFLTGFVFIKTFGVQKTIYIAACINFLLSLIFFIFHKILAPYSFIQKDREKDDTSIIPLQESYLVLLLICFCFAGFTSLAYEVIWTRLLVFILKTTIYSFSIMLTTFLLGIGLGSFLFSIIGRKIHVNSYWKLFGFIECLIGLFGIISIILFGKFEYFVQYLTVTWKQLFIQKFLLSATFMFVPTLLMGMTFPIASRLYSQHLNHIGRSIGSIYSINTLGSIVGACLTGFFIIPLLGTQNSIIFIALLNLFIGTMMICLNPVPKIKVSLRYWGIIIVIWIIGIVSIILIPQNYLFHYYSIGEKAVDSEAKILYAHEDAAGITTVHQHRDGNKVIATGSINVAGTGKTLRSTQKLQAHIPLLLHPQPKKVCQIGFGSGETSHLVLKYNIDGLDLVEISPGVLKAADKYFREVNKGVVAHERFNSIIMDGANYLRLTKQKYDLIMNDAIWPFYAGNSGLYTREHFLAGKEHLNEYGIMSSWLPLTMDFESFKILITTFHSVFPYVNFWLVGDHYNKHALITGSMRP